MSTTRLVSKRCIVLLLAGGMLAAWPGVTFSQETQDGLEFVDVTEFGERPGRDGDAERDPQAEGNRSDPIDRLVNYYLRLYGGHLESKDWVTRAMSVLSLGRIDDPRITEKLLEVLEKDDSAVVRAYAWEVLHARNPQLDEKQRERWTDAGLELATKANVLNGELRAGLLLSVAHRGPTAENRKLYEHLFRTSNLVYEGDAYLLGVMQDVLAHWRDKRLIAMLIEAMGHSDHCYRAEFLLRGLRSGLPDVSSLHDDPKKNLKVEWARYRKAWEEWLAKDDVGPAATFDRYTDPSVLLDPPAYISNPDDPKWRKDLELPKLTLNQLDVGLVMDATGSMKAALDWVKKDVVRIMKALKAISREPRIGIVLYRDRGERYRVRVFRLTSRADLLARAIQDADAEGGGDFPEGVYDGLEASLTKQRWPRSKTGAKVVLLVGDAPPHRRDMDNIQKLVTKAAERGFRFFCLSVPGRHGGDHATAVREAKQGKQEEPLATETAFDQIAKWGQGQHLSVRFHGQAQAWVAPGLQPAWGPRRINRGEDPYRLVIGGIFKSILTAEYHDRVTPFVTVLLEILDESPPETRQYLPAHRVRRHDHHHKDPPKRFQQ